MTATGQWAWVDHCSAHRSEEQPSEPPSPRSPTTTRPAWGGSSDHFLRRVEAVDPAPLDRHVPILLLPAGHRLGQEPLGLFSRLPRVVVPPGNRSNGRGGWRPAIDVNKVILGAQIVAVIALLVARAL